MQAPKPVFKYISMLRSLLNFVIQILCFLSNGNMPIFLVNINTNLKFKSQNEIVCACVVYGTQYEW